MQTIPLIIDVSLSIAQDGNLVYRVLGIDRAEVSAWSNDGISESDALVQGRAIFAVSGGVAVPDAGGYIVIGVDYGGHGHVQVLGEVAVDPVPPPMDAATIAAEVCAGLALPDAWASVLPGAYAGGQAGAILGRLAALNTAAVTQVATSAAGHLTITRALTFEATVSGVDIPGDWVTAIWTLKRAAAEADDAALLRLRTSNPSDDDVDGLQWLHGAALLEPRHAADGRMSVQATAGQIGLWLSDELTATLDEAGGLGWDVKFLDAAGNSRGCRGTADVQLTETWATV